MSVIITPADQDDARLIAATLEDGILPWPGYELRANSWPAPAVFIVPEAAAAVLLDRLYADKPGRKVEGAPVKALAKGGIIPAGSGPVIGEDSPPLVVPAATAKAMELPKPVAPAPAPEAPKPAGGALAKKAAASKNKR